METHINESDRAVDVEATPTTQAVAVRQEQAVVNPLDLEPAMFRAGLDRRKENRKALIEWVREALVEGTDFGRIPTKRGPSKPSLWKPGAEKICGMLGVTPTFPTLAEYEQNALKGIEIKSIILRCEITNSSGAIIAHGVGSRSLEQDYGDLNKALKMAEKSAHIDATLRMAGLSEIFTQDIEDMVKTTQDAPGQAATIRPPSQPTQAPPARPAPAAVAKPRVPAGVNECRDKMVKNFEAAGLREQAMKYMIDVAWLLPTERLEDLPDRWVPMTKEEYVALLAKLTAWAASGKAEKPYPAHDVPVTEQKKPVEVPREQSNPVTENAAGERWYNFIVPIPPKGMKRDAYLRAPQTIGQLYEARHGSTEDENAMRQRLWGFVHHFEPKGFVGRDGQQRGPSTTDIEFRKALDQFQEWWEKNHPGEDL